MAQKASLVKQFEGQPVTTIEYQGRPVWIAREIGRALGYENEGAKFAEKVTSDWSEDLERGTDYMVIEGDDLRDLKGALTPDSGVSAVGDHARSLTLLTESGLHLALMLSRKPAGRRLRRWLATEVLPEIARTGGYRGKGGRSLPWLSTEHRERRLALREASLNLQGARERRMRAAALAELARRLRRQGPARDRAVLLRAMDLERQAADLLRTAEQPGGAGGAAGLLAGPPGAPGGGPPATAVPRSAAGAELADVLVAAGGADLAWPVYDLGADGALRVREVLGRDMVKLAGELVFDQDGKVRARAVEAGELRGGRLLVLEADHPRAAAIAGDVADQVRMFVAERCVRGEGLSEAVGTLHEAYAEWCAKRGVPAANKNRAFAAALRQLGFRPGMLPKGRARIYRGLTLMQEGSR
jgi:prophage antirepressor-like protein